MMHPWGVSVFRGARRGRRGQACAPRHRALASVGSVPPSRTSAQQAGSSACSEVIVPVHRFGGGAPAAGPAHAAAPSAKASAKNTRSSTRSSLMCSGPREPPPWIPARETRGQEAPGGFYSKSSAASRPLTAGEPRARIPALHEPGATLPSGDERVACPGARCGAARATARRAALRLARGEQTRPIRVEGGVAARARCGICRLVALVARRVGAARLKCRAALRRSAVPARRTVPAAARRPARPTRSARRRAARCGAARSARRRPAAGRRGRRRTAECDRGDGERAEPPVRKHFSHLDLSLLEDLSWSRRNTRPTSRAHTSRRASCIDRSRACCTCPPGCSSRDT